MAPLGAPGFRCLSILETSVQVNASHSPAARCSVGFVSINGDWIQWVVSPTYTDGILGL